MADLKWISDYLSMIEKHEVSTLGHRWAAVSAIAGILGRNVWVDRGLYRTFPNHYIFFVGRSGVRKSTAAKVATKMLSSILSDRGEEFAFFSGSTTARAFSQILEDAQDVDVSHKPPVVNRGAQVYVFASELSRFIIGGGKETLLHDLTDYYDCEDELPTQHRTATQGAEKLYHVCVNLLACTTPKWVTHAFSGDQVGEGFMGRTLLVYLEKNSRIWEPQLNRTKKKELTVRLERVGQLKGEFKLSGEAREFIKRWYEIDLPETSDERMESMFERWGEHVLKLSMVLKAAEEDGSLLISEENVKTAISWLEEVRAKIPKALVEVVSDARARLRHKVLVYIDERKEVQHSDVLKYFSSYNINTEELGKIIQFWVSLGQVKVEDKEGETGRTSRWYVKV